MKCGECGGEVRAPNPLYTGQHGMVLDELKRRLDQVDRYFKILGTVLLVLYTALFSILWFVIQMPPFSAAAIATFVFQGGMIWYGLSFVARHFVRGDYKSDLSIELGVKASRNQDKIADTLVELNKSIKESKDPFGPGEKGADKEKLARALGGGGGEL